jgi:hypothetical protein
MMRCHPTFLPGSDLLDRELRVWLPFALWELFGTDELWKLIEIFDGDACRPTTICNLEATSPEVENPSSLEVAFLRRSCK